MKSARYRIDRQGYTCIELRLKSPLQLFDSRDPAPFLDRDLDDDAVDYVLSSAEEFSLSTPMKVHFYFSEPQVQSQGLTEPEIRGAFHGYFDYQADLLRKKLRRRLKNARTLLAVAIAVMGGCVWLATVLSEVLPSSTLSSVLQQGLVIAGWVAMWQPLQIYLYEWWPLSERRKVYQKLAKVPLTAHWSAAQGSVAQATLVPTVIKEAPR